MNNVDQKIKFKKKFSHKNCSYDFLNIFNGYFYILDCNKQNKKKIMKIGPRVLELCKLPKIFAKLLIFSI